MQTNRPRRRHVLLAGATLVSTLAGCGSNRTDADGTGTDDTGGNDGQTSGGGSDGQTDAGGSDGQMDDGGSDGRTNDASAGTGDGNGNADGTTTPAPGGGDGSSTDTATATPTATDGGTDALDLREANVVAVAFSGSDGTYDFDVTLHHDDDGEEGYANWWQVERLDGTQLGRRKLLHAHSRQPFTRSETIEIPSEVSCVVVRGHDQTHGYGGQAMLVTLDTGATTAVDQGTDPRSFSVEDCP